MVIIIYLEGMRAEQDSKLLPYVTLPSGLDLWLLSFKPIVAKKVAVLP